MSPENADVVRQAVAVNLRSHRSVEERVGLRLPGVLALLARAVLRLPPRSRLRRAWIRRSVRLGFEAVNREDFEAAFVLYHPDAEVIEPPEVVALGLDPVARGREGRIQVQRRWRAQWGALRVEPEEVTDLGDRLLVVSRMKGSGASSGAGFDQDLANLVELSGGRVIREKLFLNRADALEAVGLGE